jgi:hypothetical protein
MVIPLQDIIPLRAQHGQKIAVATQHGGLVLDPGRHILFVEHLAASNDGVGQLSRGAIEEDDVDQIRLQGSGQFVGETSLHATPIDGSIDQYGEVIVAHRAKVPLDLGAKKIDQLDGPKTRQYGQQHVLHPLHVHGISLP